MNEWVLNNTEKIGWVINGTNDFCLHALKEFEDLIKHFMYG